MTAPQRFLNGAGDAEARKRRLLDRLLANEGFAVDRDSAFPPREHADRAPLSFAQQRLWFLGRFNPGSAAYNVPLVIPFPGALRVGALERTLNAIVERHEILRTRFELDGDQPVQVIDPHVRVALRVVEGRGGAPQRGQEERRLLAGEAGRPFDLSRPGLVRACLVRWGPNDHTLLVTLHHIVTDAWSMDILAAEMTAFYNAFSTGRSISLPELPVQYADYAAWQRRRLTGNFLEQELEYWRERLDGAPLLELPTDRPRPQVATTRGAAHRFVIPGPLARALGNLAEAENVTLFMLTLGIFLVLLHRYSGQDDIVVGLPIAGRVRPEVEPLIGFFVNSLVLRTRLDQKPGFDELLRRVRDSAVGAFAHQEFPFEKLVEELQPERDLSRNPFFQVIFQLLRGGAEQRGSSGGGDSAEIQAKFDLSFTLQEQGGQIAAFVEYNADLYDADTVEQMCRHYSNLAGVFAASPRTPIGTAAMLDGGELDALRSRGGGRAVAHPPHTLDVLLDHAAAAYPGNVAVDFEEYAVTFSELHARANRLARHLVRRGIGPDQVVAIRLHRSVEMVVAIVATLKAGGAWLALDPDGPAERIEYMIQDSNAQVVIQRGSLPAGSRRIAIDPDRDEEEIRAEEDTAPPVSVDPENLAYVIYTSGSTGRPKGVMVPHRAITNHMHWMNSRYAFTAQDAVLQKTPVTFDASIWEVLAPLMSGGRLVLARPGGHRDAAYMVRTVMERGVSILQTVPSQLDLILDAPGIESCDRLRLVFSGGEPLPAALCVRFRKRVRADLHNLYGPTESTIDATAWPCNAIGPGDRVPIGKPIDNVHAYVLDGYGNMVPRGVSGVLCLGGAGVARGYLGSAHDSKQLFRPDPFSPNPDARMYVTGDLVRRRRDGALEFLGRMDRQVKLRGYRVEPDEVSRVLETHPDVARVVTNVARTREGHEQLAVYVVPSSDAPPPRAGLRAYLRRSLPEYMIPTWISFVGQIPETPHGKVDWRALPEPEPDIDPRTSRSAGVGPPLGRRMSMIWEEVLGSGPVGLDSNFFDLGGHSMLMVQIQHRLKRDLDMDVSLLDLFRFPTLRLLSAHLGDPGAVDSSAAESHSPGRGAPTRARPRMQARPIFRRPGTGGPGGKSGPGGRGGHTGDRTGKN